MPMRLKQTEAEFLPQVARRFLFDDAALREQQANTAGCGPAAAKELFKSEQAPIYDINDIVDCDEVSVVRSVTQNLVASVLPSLIFRGFILMLIIVNGIIICIQTDEALGQEYAYLFSILDQFVLSVFVAEILLKWYHGFWIFWRVGWNILDFVIVAAILLGPAFQHIGSSRILRILRVLRAARSLRSISGLQGLSLVVQTVLQSLPDMFNIALVLCIILLVFAVAGITLFGKELPKYFGDLNAAMFTLFICITQDGWVAIHSEFQKMSGWQSVAGTLYFILAITVGAFVFANLAVAAVVTNLEIAMKQIKAENKGDDALKYVDSEDLDRVPIVPVDEATKNVSFSEQAPIQAPDLKNLSVRKLENYFMILMALEENLAEYKAIRDDLDKTFDVACELNAQEKLNVSEHKPSRESKANGLRDHSPPSVKHGPVSYADIRKMKGDIISNMKALAEQSTKYAGQFSTTSSLDDVIKTSAK